MWSPNPIGQLTNITASVVRLDGADDEVAAGLDVDPAVHAAQAGDGDVVPVPDNGQVPRGALPLTDKADHVALRLVLVERRVGDDGSSWRYYLETEANTDQILSDRNNFHPPIGGRGY